MASAEHRRHRRVGVRDIAAHIEAPRGFLTCAVENLSQGGMFVRTPRPMPAGSTITLHLVRPGMKKAIRLTGRVASVVDLAQARESGSRPGMGIRFDELDGMTIARLAQLLRELGGEAALAVNVFPQPVASASRPGPPAPAEACEPRPFLIPLDDDGQPFPAPAGAAPAGAADARSAGGDAALVVSAVEAPGCMGLLRDALLKLDEMERRLQSRDDDLRRLHQELASLRDSLRARDLAPGTEVTARVPH